ncbi:BTAD domain-containing putative transcriptional regulator [Streptomyces sp. BBFR25]|uniref:AfsR/SARP family transcriptional regulator n=1 Tax=unclassified Streptomyces TaxID=2593676 RepID=UPI001EE8EEC1|nr:MULTISPECIES: BTAD domain-containing putative transcriptional regulator [unclassified Streptomyces]
MDAKVHYSVLGTVRAMRGERQLAVGPPKRLALLSLLVLRAPGPVSLRDAVDVLWDHEPPASAVNIVHRNIGALRKLLEPGLSSRALAEHLSRSADGYRLLLDASTSDLLHFRDLRARAQLAVKNGDAAEAALHFTDALRLWRSPVVADGTQVAQHPVFTSVGHEFVATAKEAADVVLTAAPASTEEVLTALRRAVEGHPFDEALHSHIIAALATTGRQAEALDQFERIRRTLADDLGVEPGAGLRSVQQRYLRRNRAHNATTGPQSAPAFFGPVHLPDNSVPFVGRTEELNRCRRFLPSAASSNSTATIVALCGMAGVGKTTLAVHWARESTEHFPDGQIYVDLQGHHPTRAPLGTAHAMRAVLDALGSRPSGEDRDDAALGLTYRSALARRRLLLVLDDVRDCEQVRPLLPAAAGSLVVLTSRRRLEGLAVTHHARLVTLAPMALDEGVELLERRIGSERVRAEQAFAEQIVELCGGLPLTLALAGTRALMRSRFSLASLAAELREGLVALSSRDARTDASTAFRRSYDALSAGAARMLRLLALHPSHEFTLRAAASLAGSDLRTARENLAELADHHLLEEVAPERYTRYELLRSFAADLSAAEDSNDVRSTACARMLEHYLYSANAATALLTPHRRTVILPPPRPGVRPQEFGGRADAADWLVAERFVLPALDRSLSHHPQGETFRQQLKAMLTMPIRPDPR